VLAELRASALGMDRPPMVALHRRLANASIALGMRPPSRASLYKAIARLGGHTYDVSQLPPHVACTLYNLAAMGTVPGQQLAFYCFNYGSVAAASYAAGLPWLDLYQAARLRGWRPRSRGLLEAVLRVRGI
jgi:hypothetical protein